MTKNKITLVNMISGLILQLCTLISGFIVPRIVLSYFGSDVNGLVSSINQFLSYIALVEGGVTGVINANLYKPLIDGDREQLSSVLVSADSFYKKIGLIFVVYSVIVAATYPILFGYKYNFSYMYIFALAMILAINLFIQYMFSLTYRCIIEVDKKGYIVNFSQAAIVVLNVILVIISVKIYPSIHILKLISGLLFIIQPIIFGRYVNKHYNIDWKAPRDNTLIKERWNGFTINMAAFIHSSVDITILTIFTDLKTVSIYSVYLLVCNGIKQLVNASLSGINHTVGQAYAKGDYDEINSKMDIYESVVFILVFFIFTVTALLITPFVRLYTSGITDTNYNQPVFGVLLVLSEGLYLIKNPHVDLAYSANKFREVTVPAFVEAVINIVVSIILVRRFGLIGVVCGTIAAMTYRLIFHIYFTTKIIPGRNQGIFYRKLLAFSAVTAVGVLICVNLLPFVSVTIPQWLIHAIVYSIIMGTLYLLLSTVIFKKEMKFFLKYLKK